PAAVAADSSAGRGLLATASLLPSALCGGAPLPALTVTMPMSAFAAHGGGTTPLSLELLEKLLQQGDQAVAFGLATLPGLSALSAVVLVMLHHALAELRLLLRARATTLGLCLGGHDTFAARLSAG